MKRTEQNRTEIILHAFIMGVFFLFMLAFIGNTNSASEFAVGHASIASEQSFDHDALPGTIPKVPDFDQETIVSSNTEFFGLSKHLFSLLEADRRFELELLQQNMTWQNARPLSTLIVLARYDFSPRGEKYPAIS